MERGSIGPGRTADDMAERLVRRGHPVISFDCSPEATWRVIDKAVRPHSLGDFIAQLTSRSAAVSSSSPKSACEKDPVLEAINGCVDDSGKGRWTMLEAIERGVAVTVLAQSLFTPSLRVGPTHSQISSSPHLRKEFGGHAVQKG